MSVGTKNEYTRELWLEASLKRVPAGSRILDAGAGEQKYRRFCGHLHYVSQDFAQYNGKGDGRGLQTGAWQQSRLDIVSDITEIPEPDASFDAIMCVEVFEHLKEPVQAIREFCRLLKPDGHLIITAPFCSLTHFAPYHYYTGFNRYFYETFMDKFGFSIVDLQENGNYFEYIAQEVRRLPYVAERFAGFAWRFKERLVSSMLLKILQKLSSRDCGSSQLLHFGFHVHAIKSADIPTQEKINTPETHI